MELNTILWAGGTFFALSIFSIKVGLGLAYGKVSLKGILTTLFFYLALFITIAYFAEKILNYLQPLLIKGPYLHSFMAIGMIIWGVILLKRRGETLFLPLPLLIPCPVCLTAIAFSIWSFREVIKLPPLWMGLFLGMGFIGLTIILIIYTKFRKPKFPEVNLAFIMIILGLYYLFAFYVPQKIEEAKAVYSAFAEKNSSFDSFQNWSVILLLLGTIILGYLLKISEGKK